MALGGGAADFSVEKSVATDSTTALIELREGRVRRVDLALQECLEPLPQLLYKHRRLGGGGHGKPAIDDDPVRPVLHLDLAAEEEERVGVDRRRVPHVHLGGLDHLVIDEHLGIELRLHAEVQARRVKEHLALFRDELRGLLRGVQHDDVRVQPSSNHRLEQP
eukprot:CAMPEP_0180150154 /NCGR_PEP_ID=MMETSP0986-20121125/21283_1 /TAXON_ID=697907 /ORGANISM="non described non described, Strain CCMP2293" /LENGTH=162 /DNA_ID=CAMNT_0022097041 /DNA_START=164 /DNA_END=647 /DNA_ORIENTATION=-